MEGFGNPDENSRYSPVRPLGALKYSERSGTSTNFAIEAIEQVFNGEADFGKKVTATISRNGDLINRVYLEVKLPALLTTYLDDPTGGTGDYDQLVYTNSIGHALIKECKIEIGGQQIDRHFGEWLEIKIPMSQKVI